MEDASMKTIIVICILFIGLAGCGTSSATIKHISYGVEPTSPRFECKGKCSGFHSSLVSDPNLTANMFDHLNSLLDYNTDPNFHASLEPRPVQPRTYQITFLRDDALGVQISVLFVLTDTNFGWVSWEDNLWSLDATFIKLFDQLYAKTQGVPFPTPTPFAP